MGHPEMAWSYEVLVDRLRQMGRIEEACTPTKRGRSTHPYFWSGFVASGDWR